MAQVYKFSEKEIEEIAQARRENKDKRAEARLKALEMRARGAKGKEIAAATGFHSAYAAQLASKYKKGGIEAIAGNHYGGNHRNMSVEEEAEILAPFRERAEKGELVDAFRDFVFEIIENSVAISTWSGNSTCEDCFLA